MVVESQSDPLEMVRLPWKKIMSIFKSNASIWCTQSKIKGLHLFLKEMCSKQFIALVMQLLAV